MKEKNKKQELNIKEKQDNIDELKDKYNEIIFYELEQTTPYYFLIGYYKLLY